MVPNQEALRWVSGSEQSENQRFLRILDSFQQATKLRVRLFPLQEKGEISSIYGEGHPFCQLIRSCSAGRENCLKEINRAVQISLKIGEPSIFQCHTDMIEFTAPLIEGKNNFSAFVCGPILLRPLNPVLKQSILAKVKGLCLDDDSSLIRTLSEIPVFSERRVQAAADLLFMIANYFSNVDSASQQKEHEITRQQALLAEELFLGKQRKSDDATAVLSHLQPRGDLYKEKELVDLIKMGDRKGAKGLLDELLGTTLFRSHEHIGILKARALEIIFIIARAAVEAGANLEEILGFKYQYIQNLSRDDSQETLYYFLKKAFDQLFECIYQNRNIRHTRVFIKAKEYIWGHYNQEISLKKTALAVEINPFYLSHLFRKEMGISFLEYLTSVRISIAKKLLMQKNMSMMQICLEVGYQDPSHFAKIFKKKEGIRPTEYRKRLIEQNIG
ncbi:MAG: PocR ligand-binding domain-containing protein [Deltaproteobacteria bacterium]|nr:PocR ligand-binding domain-containing protein [Deltaproteobacteria bacterium]